MTRRNKYRSTQLYTQKVKVRLDADGHLCITWMKLHAVLCFSSCPFGVGSKLMKLYFLHRTTGAGGPALDFSVRINP